MSSDLTWSLKFIIFSFIVPYLICNGVFMLYLFQEDGIRIGREDGLS